ncbi:methionine ABC transporter ATP-binding protein [Pseudobutyrivibrio sp.]|uniref:methionine ABC transporter ATP-binding protein n=1 Tax=Pseudobutyrivibrio sp. TaxID=2014367 RepID=UPI001D73D9D1|nr:ATP-binding cassette domain-containing protein [Pseudobutyrivibrio sp.]MBE5910763.1 ATP-binding cassette domain-containing protein [Pseudobutyrivibrio sp.]
MIRLENVSKEFKTKSGKVDAVHNVSFEIRDGEIFGIIGFSGAGKSTLVRCLNMLERPTAGKVIFEDLDLTNASEKELRTARRSIGMIFQQFNLLAQRNVIDNVCYPLEISGVKRKKALEKARELLALVDLADKEKSYPAQLSGGQKQRVAIARALATDPKVLLCDEATSALDPLTTRNILKLLKDINKKLGVTIVIITHEMRVVEQICDRVAVMSQGVVEEFGDVREIFKNPKSETARKLIVPEEEDGGVPVPTKDYIRVVFDGQSSYEPAIAQLILHTGMELNILGASTADIGGSAYGQLLIETPKDRTQVEEIKEFLSSKGVFAEEVKNLQKGEV